MDIKDMNKGLCNLKLNAITSVDNDPLLLKLTFSILDFNTSGNRQIISRELAEEAKASLKGKPLLCVYTPNTGIEGEFDDHFNGHGEEIKVDRYGNEYIGTNSIIIGTSLEEGYITTITDEFGDEQSVLACEFYVWKDRNKEVVQLINEIYEQGLPLYSSCEYYYFNYEMKDGIQVIKSPLLFSGHCCLGSGENGSEIVEPAYDCSKLLSMNEKLNKAINQCIKKSNAIDIEQINKEDSKKEDDKMENKMFELLKSTNAISASSIRWRIYDELAKVMLAVDYENVYIGEYDIFPEDHYFLLETYTQEGGYKLFKCNYAVGGGDVVTVDYANAVEVEYKYKVELAPVEELQTSLNAKDEELKVANDKIVELEKSLNSKIEELGVKEETIKSLNEKVETVESEKVATIDKFNSASDTIVSLNSKVDELSETVEILKPLADKYNEEQYTKALNSAVDSYKVTFNKAGVSLELLEEESTMELIKKTLNSKEDEVKEAKFQLNQLIIDNMTGIKVEKEEEPIAKSVNSVVKGKETKGLVDNFVDPYEEFCGFSR